MQQSQRDIGLDNLKGILIISVVYVHLYDMLGQKTPLSYTLRLIILSVQMPLFLFLCGYFGKHVERRRDTALQEYLLPFLIFNGLYYLMRIGQEPDIRYGLLRPLNMYWFLMTLLLIRLLMPQLLHIRRLPLVSFVCALVVGCDKYFGRLLSLSRTVCFLPFYLAGYYCPKEYLDKARRIPLPVAWLCGIAGSFLTLCLTDILRPAGKVSHPFQLVNTYAKQGLPLTQGILFRVAIYIAAPLLAILLLRLTPRVSCFLTHIGSGSMTVYLLHAFPMLWIIDHKQGIWAIFCKLLPFLAQLKAPGKFLFGIPQLILFLGYSILMSVFLSSPVIQHLYTSLFDELKTLIFHTEKSDPIVH